MPKYLINAQYTPEGVKGLATEGGTKRRDAATKAIKSVGGKVEAFYFAFGETDAILIVDAPDHASVGAANMAINSTGKVRCTTTVLLTPAEVDEAAKRTASYRAPGE